MKRKLILAILLVGALGGAAGWFLWREPPRLNVLSPRPGATEIAVMDFSRPFVTEPLPAGWHHRKFWLREEASFAWAVKQRVPALRVETNDSASMLMRHVEIDLVRYPLLRWRWLVEKPIESAIDERTAEGDDHPARLFIAFRNDAGARRALEIIWGNSRLKKGDTKTIEGFSHYVANGGADNLGRWHDEQVDLLKLYRKMF